MNGMSDREKQHIEAQLKASQADRLLGSFRNYRNNPRDAQGRIIIPYGFVTKDAGLPVDYHLSIINDLRMPSAEQRQMIEAVLKEYEAAANIVFQRMGEGQQASLLFGSNPQHEGGLAMPGGDGILVALESEIFGASPEYMRELIRHEVGHALGFNHSNDPDRTFFKKPAKMEVEHHPNTVMNQDINRADKPLDSLGIADMLALQKLYGAPKVSAGQTMDIALPLPGTHAGARHVPPGVRAQLDVSGATSAKVDLRTGIDHPTVIDGERKLVFTPGSHIEQVTGLLHQGATYHSSFKGQVQIKGGDGKDHYHLWGPQVIIQDSSREAGSESHIHIHKGAGGLLQVHSMDALALHFPQGKQVSFTANGRNPNQVMLTVQHEGNETSRIEIRTTVAVDRGQLVQLQQRHNQGLANQPPLKPDQAEQDVECPATPATSKGSHCSR